MSICEPYALTTMKNNSLKFASIGSVSSDTLRTQDLLESFSNELEWQINRNGNFLSLPENFPMRDRLAKLLGEARDAWSEEGKALQDEETASEIVGELQDALGEFSPQWGYFGAHEGDGACFGFWVDIDAAKEDCNFVSSKDGEYPSDDYEGEWLHINERGNATLYLRENAQDAEIWSLV